MWVFHLVYKRPSNFQLILSLTFYPNLTSLFPSLSLWQQDSNRHIPKNYKFDSQARYHVTALTFNKNYQWKLWVSPKDIQGVSLDEDPKSSLTRSLSQYPSLSLSLSLSPSLVRGESSLFGLPVYFNIIKCHKSDRIISIPIWSNEMMIWSYLMLLTVCYTC